MGLSYPTGLFELLIIGRLLTGMNAGNSQIHLKTSLLDPSEMYIFVLDRKKKKIKITQKVPKTAITKSNIVIWDWLSSYCSH